MSKVLHLAGKVFRSPVTILRVVWRFLEQLYSPPLRKLNFYLFGNTLTLRSNTLHLTYYLACRLIWLIVGRVAKTEEKELKKKLDSNGFIIFEKKFDELKLKKTVEKINKAFENPSNLAPLPSGSNVKRLKKTTETFPEILEIFDTGIASQLETWFGCHIKLFSVDLYQLHAFHADANTAELWHFDNSPCQQIKVLVYLQDTDHLSGALSVKHKQVSVSLRRRGYWDRYNAPNFQDDLTDPKSTVVLEADMGSAIIFQNNTVLHKATPPKQGIRTTLAFLVIPSLVPWRKHFDKSRKKQTDYLTLNQGYCINPITNKPLRYGYK